MTKAERARERYWDLKGVPRVIPRRSWVCVYCSAHGPSDSEEETIRLTRAHMVTCAARKRYEARIDRARKAMEAAAV